MKLFLKPSSNSHWTQTICGGVNDKLELKSTMTQHNEALWEQVREKTETLSKKIKQFMIVVLHRVISKNRIEFVENNNGVIHSLLFDPSQKS